MSFLSHLTNGPIKFYVQRCDKLQGYIYRILVLNIQLTISIFPFMKVILLSYSLYFLEENKSAKCFICIKFKSCLLNCVGFPRDLPFAALFEMTQTSETAFNVKLSDSLV